MFHNSSSSFGPSTSRTPGRTQSLIHNDENANTFTKHNNLKNHDSNAKINGSENSKPNSTMKPKSNSKQTFGTMNAKSKTPLNTRRRAFGDISNRTNEGSGTGNSSSNNNVSKSTTKSKSASASTGFSIYTPHKEHESAKKKGLAPSALKQTSKKFPSSTVKRKTVTFSIHTEPDLELNEASQKEYQNKYDNELKGGVKSIPRNEVYDDVEDIEVCSGRTGLEERELLGEELDRVDANTERDIEEALRAIRGSRDQTYAKATPPLRVDDDLGQETINAALKKFEEVDEDVLQSYLMFDEYKGLDLELDVGGEEDDDLMLHIDNLSI